jgi:hypothetical protein
MILNIVKEWFVKRKICFLKLPTQSPDLNSIEHLWDEVGRRVAVRKCMNFEELYERLVEEWNENLIEGMQTLVDSMPRRCMAVVLSFGHNTKY